MSERDQDERERERARAWLYSTFTRVARARCTQTAPPHDLVTLSLPVAAGTDDEDQVLAVGHHALRRLPPSQREVFWLYEILQLSMVDVAAALGCSRRAAYSRLFRGRSRLLAELQRVVVREATHG